MDDRHTTTAVLWVVGALALALFMFEGLPWLWPRLFPGPGASQQAAADGDTGDRGDSGAAVAAVPGTSPDGRPLTPEYAAEVLHRFLAGWGVGEDLDASTIQLPQGKRPRELQDGLRADGRLGSAEVYVTKVDDLLHRVRVFDGPQLLLLKDVQPWLPDRPVVSGSDPPELGLVVILRDGDEQLLKKACRRDEPLAIALPPFAPHAVKAARQASWYSKGVIALVDPNDTLAEQVRASPAAGGVLIEADFPEGLDIDPWLKSLASAGLFLLDGRSEVSPEFPRHARALGVSYVRRAAALDGGLNASRLARNLTIRRGYGYVSVDGDEAGLAALDAFIEGAANDGYEVAFPVEVARMHGEGRATPDGG